MTPQELIRIAETMRNEVAVNINIEKVIETWCGDYLVTTSSLKQYLIDHHSFKIVHKGKETLSNAIF